MTGAGADNASVSAHSQLRSPGGGGLGEDVLVLKRRAQVRSDAPTFITALEAAKRLTHALESREQWLMGVWPVELRPARRRRRRRGTNAVSSPQGTQRERNGTTLSLAPEEEEGMTF